MPVFRRRFTVDTGLKAAKLRLTAHGIFEAEINGIPVTNHKFLPGLTSYYYRIQIPEYDVTELLKPGDNCWQTTVGDGWWRWNKNFGPRLALWGELTLEYAGRTEQVVTDESFFVGTGPVIRTDLQKGEYFDARIEPDCRLTPVIETAHTDAEMIPAEGVHVRDKELFPGKLIKDSVGITVIDFGQNISGYVQMRLYNTKSGQVVHLKHGEALDLAGEFSTANCDGGKTDFQVITFICKGAEIEE